MKLNTIVFSLTVFLGAQFASAEITKKPLTQVTAYVFDANCVKKNESEGYLKVAMELEGYYSGDFFSYVGPSDPNPEKSVLIPLAQCQELREGLLRNLAKPIFFDGTFLEETHQETEQIHGICREHPLIGGDRPCIKGTRQVTRYEREYVLNLDSIFIYVNYNF